MGHKVLGGREKVKVAVVQASPSIYGQGRGL